jgi:phosphatidate phosphatase APP1
LIIMPYLGYGTGSRITLCGRVLQDEGFRPTRDTEKRWRNLVAFYKRLESDEVPGARLRATLGGKAACASTNREGYFSITLDGLALEAGWHEVRLHVVRKPEVRAIGRVLVPSPRARFGVVSDIDDTVVFSHVRNKLKMVLALALSNARTRKPFKGVTAFYRALHAGVNPIFYVSKSPWNLYAPLVEYLEHQGLPAGPLVLREFGLRMNRRHKTEAIEAILETYPRLPFVLIGDSGEDDARIYSDIGQRFPGRIRAVYIRSVSKRKIPQTGYPLILAPDSEFAAAHAAGEGLIQASDLREVRSDRRSDESSSPKALASSGALK